MATQLPMFKISAVLDYGSLPGSSHARRLEAADEQIYIAKGPHSRARNPFVLINEYVCTRLALEAGMPVPPMALIKSKSNLWFGSLKRPEIDTFTPDLFDANILNKGECAHLAVFDIFVKNGDRKSRNVLAGKSFSKKSRAGFEYELSGIAFGHALISPASRLDRLGEWQDPRTYYRDSVLIRAELIEDQSDIDDGVAGLRFPEDVDLEAGHVVVAGKGSKRRRVALRNGSRQWLDLWLIERGDTPGGLLAGRTSATSTYQIVKRLARDAGVGDVTPHRLRATCATMLSRRGVSLKTTARVLGHSKIETTARYQTVDAEEAWAAMDELHVPAPEPGKFGNG